MREIEEKIEKIVNKYISRNLINMHEIKNEIEMLIGHNVDINLIESYLNDKIDNSKQCDIKLNRNSYNAFANTQNDKRDMYIKDDNENNLSVYEMINMDPEDLLNLDINFNNLYTEEESNQYKNRCEEFESIHKYKDNKIILGQYEKTKENKFLNELVQNNQKLVRKYANIYSKYIDGKAIDYDDLIQVGNLGLIKAIERFKSEKGTVFSTYATLWIKQFIFKEIMDKGNTVRIPVHLSELMLKIRKLENKYYNIDSNNYIRLVCKEARISLEKYNEIKTVYSLFIEKMVHLDVPIGEDRDTDLKNLIVDIGVDVFDEVIKIDCREKIDNILGTLKPREEAIIRLRFGIDDNIDRTLEQVGEIFHLTRERIRQIEVKALRKLRHHSRSKYLKDFFYT